MRLWVKRADLRVHMWWGMWISQDSVWEDSTVLEQRYGVPLSMSIYQDFVDKPTREIRMAIKGIKAGKNRQMEQQQSRWYK